MAGGRAVLKVMRVGCWPKPSPGTALWRADPAPLLGNTIDMALLEDEPQPLNSQPLQGMRARELDAAELVPGGMGA